MTNSEFYTALQLGDYIYVQDGGSSHNVHVEQIAKITNTQIVVQWLTYSDEISENRFNRHDGYERGSSQFYYRKWIKPEKPLESDIAHYLEIKKGNLELKERRKKANDEERRIKERIVSRFPLVDANCVSVQANSSDGLVTVSYDISIKGISEKDFDEQI